ncbi:MAG: O-antigen ligase family protein [bacterium]|nr:O-antigen ligase family protein [bacterium]
MENIFKKITQFDKTDLKIGIVFVFFSILTLNYLFLGNNFLIFLAFFFCATIVIWDSPQAGILGVMLTLMIFGESFSLLPVQIGKQVYKIYAMDLAMLLIFAFWFLQAKIMQRKLSLNILGRKNIWLSIFFLVLFFSLLRSIFLQTDLTLAIGTFKNYAYLLVYFLALNLFSSWKEIFRILRVLFFGGLLIIGFVFWGFLAGKGLWTESTPGLRYLSGLHTYYLTFSLIILFVGLAYNDYFRNKFSTGIIFVIQTAGVIGSMFRHLWLGFLCALFAMWLFMRKSEKKNILQQFSKLASLGFFILIFFLWILLLSGKEVDFLNNNTLISSIVKRAQTLTQTSYEMESAAGWRLSAWQSAGQEYLKSPVLGIGLGKKIFLDYNNFLDLVDVRNIHNDMLSILAQLGIVGFIPFVLFHFYLAKDLLLALRKNEDHRQLLLITTGFGIVAIFGAFFALYISFTGTAIFYWMVMAMISIVVKLSQTQ